MCGFERLLRGCSWRNRHGHKLSHADVMDVNCREWERNMIYMKYTDHHCLPLPATPVYSNCHFRRFRPHISSSAGASVKRPLLRIICHIFKLLFQLFSSFRDTRASARLPGTCASWAKLWQITKFVAHLQRGSAPSSTPLWRGDCAPISICALHSRKYIRIFVCVSAGERAVYTPSKRLLQFSFSRAPTIRAAVVAATTSDACLARTMRKN